MATSELFPDSLQAGMCSNDRSDIFNEFIQRCANLQPMKVAVSWPNSDVALAGAMEAFQAGLILPILVGEEMQLRALAEQRAIDLRPFRIVDVKDAEEAVARSVELCRVGEASALMKGDLHTDLLMSAVIDKQSGLRGLRRMSHIFIVDAPLYSRTLLISDAAINIYPTLEDKVDIVQNAIWLAHALGNPEPRVAILSAIETVNPKIRSTVDAASLCKMAERGQIAGGILDGPLAFDTAVSVQAAAIKRLSSPVAGAADILIVPDLESGNMLAKQLEYLASAHLAGIVVGARVPIILTSRADPACARLASCAIAALFAEYERSDKKVSPVHGTV
jgi:phosphate acetyltransferase